MASVAHARRAVHVAAAAQHDLVGHRLDRRGEIHLALGERGVRIARRAAEQRVELRRGHGEALAVVEVPHVHAERSVVAQVDQVLEDAIEEARLAVRREPHHLVLGAVHLEAGVVRERGVEQAERMRESAARASGRCGGRARRRGSRWTTRRRRPGSGSRPPRTATDRRRWRHATRGGRRRRTCRGTRRADRGRARAGCAASSRAIAEAPCAATRIRSARTRGRSASGDRTSPAASRRTRRSRDRRSCSPPPAGSSRRRRAGSPRRACAARSAPPAPRPRSRRRAAARRRCRDRRRRPRG